MNTDLKFEKFYLSSQTINPKFEIMMTTGNPTSNFIVLSFYSSKCKQGKRTIVKSFLRNLFQTLSSSFDSIFEDIPSDSGLFYLNQLLPIPIPIQGTQKKILILYQKVINDDFGLSEQIKSCILMAAISSCIVVVRNSKQDSCDNKALHRLYLILTLLSKIKAYNGESLKFPSVVVIKNFFLSQSSSDVSLEEIINGASLSIFEKNSSSEHVRNSINRILLLDFPKIKTEMDATNKIVKPCADLLETCMNSPKLLNHDYNISMTAQEFLLEASHYIKLLGKINLEGKLENSLYILLENFSSPYMKLLKEHIKSQYKILKENILHGDINCITLKLPDLCLFLNKNLYNHYNRKINTLFEIQRSDKVLTDMYHTVLNNLQKKENDKALLISRYEDIKSNLLFEVARLSQENQDLKDNIDWNSKSIDNKSKDIKVICEKIEEKSTELQENKKIFFKLQSKKEHRQKKKNEMICEYQEMTNQISKMGDNLNNLKDDLQNQKENEDKLIHMLKILNNQKDYLTLDICSKMEENLSLSKGEFNSLQSKLRNQKVKIDCINNNNQILKLSASITEDEENLRNISLAIVENNKNLQDILVNNARTTRLLDSYPKDQSTLQILVDINKLKFELNNLKRKKSYIEDQMGKLNDEFINHQSIYPHEKFISLSCEIENMEKDVSLYDEQAKISASIITNTQIKKNVIQLLEIQKENALKRRNRLEIEETEVINIKKSIDSITSEIQKNKRQDEMNVSSEYRKYNSENIITVDNISIQEILGQMTDISNSFLRQNSECLLKRQKTSISSSLQDASSNLDTGVGITQYFGKAYQQRQGLYQSMRPHLRQLRDFSRNVFMILKQLPGYISRVSPAEKSLESTFQNSHIDLQVSFIPEESILELTRVLHTFDDINSLPSISEHIQILFRSQGDTHPITVEFQQIINSIFAKPPHQDLKHFCNYSFLHKTEIPFIIRNGDSCSNLNKEILTIMANPHKVLVGCYALFDNNNLDYWDAKTTFVNRLFNTSFQKKNKMIPSQVRQIWDYFIILDLNASFDLNIFHENDFTFCDVFLFFIDNDDFSMFYQTQLASLENKYIIVIQVDNSKATAMVSQNKNKNKNILITSTLEVDYQNIKDFLTKIPVYQHNVESFLCKITSISNFMNNISDADECLFSFFDEFLHQLSRIFSIKKNEEIREKIISLFGMLSSYSNPEFSIAYRVIHEMEKVCHKENLRFNSFFRELCAADCDGLLMKNIIEKMVDVHMPIPFNEAFCKLRSKQLDEKKVIAVSFLGRQALAIARKVFMLDYPINETDGIYFTFFPVNSEAVIMPIFIPSWMKNQKTENENDILNTSSIIIKHSDYVIYIPEREELPNVISSFKKHVIRLCEIFLNMTACYGKPIDFQLIVKDATSEEKKKIDSIVNEINSTSLFHSLYDMNFQVEELISILVETAGDDIQIAEEIRNRVIKNQHASTMMFSQWKERVNDHLSIIKDTTATTASILDKIVNDRYNLETFTHKIVKKTLLNCDMQSILKANLSYPKYNPIQFAKEIDIFISHTVSQTLQIHDIPISQQLHQTSITVFALQQVYFKCINMIIHFLSNELKKDINQDLQWGSGFIQSKAKQILIFPEEYFYQLAYDFCYISFYMKDPPPIIHTVYFDICQVLENKNNILFQPIQGYIYNHDTFSQQSNCISSQFVQIHPIVQESNANAIDYFMNYELIKKKIRSIIFPWRKASVVRLDMDKMMNEILLDLEAVGYANNDDYRRNFGDLYLCDMNEEIKCETFSEVVIDYIREIIIKDKPERPVNPERFGKKKEKESYIKAEIKSLGDILTINPRFIKDKKSQSVLQFYQDPCSRLDVNAISSFFADGNILNIARLLDRLDQIILDSLNGSSLISTNVKDYLLTANDIDKLIETASNMSNLYHGVRLLNFKSIDVITRETEMILIDMARAYSVYGVELSEMFRESIIQYVMHRSAIVSYANYKILSLSSLVISYQQRKKDIEKI